jgi:hypothetical protein
MKVDEPFNHIRYVLFNLFDCESALGFEFFIDGSHAILGSDANLIFSFCFRVDTDNLWMADPHHMFQVLMNPLDCDWVLQALLKDLLKTVYEIGPRLLAKIDMRPFANSKQLPNLDILVLGDGL